MSWREDIMKKYGEEARRELEAYEEEEQCPDVSHVEEDYATNATT